MRRCLRWIGVAAGSGAILAGCGGSAGHRAGASVANHAATITTTATAPANGEASKTAPQILRDAQAALRRAHSLQLEGTLTDSGVPMHLRLDETAPASFDLAVHQRAQSFEVVTLPANSYLRANAAFWRANAHGGSLARLLSGRWFIVPGGEVQSLIQSFADLRSRVLARCLGENLGKLSVARHATVDGIPAVVVHDDGNVPGGGAGDLYVATVGTPYPLRVVATGPGHPGGRVDACNDGRGDTTRGALTLSAFDHAPPVRAPHDAIAIPTPGQHTV